MDISFKFWGAQRKRLYFTITIRQPFFKNPPHTLPVPISSFHVVVIHKFWVIEAAKVNHPRV